jgi:hypothetical protein
MGMMIFVTLLPLLLLINVIKCDLKSYHESHIAHSRLSLQRRSPLGPESGNDMEIGQPQDESAAAVDGCPNCHQVATVEKDVKVVGADTGNHQDDSDTIDLCPICLSSGEEDDVVVGAANVHSRKCGIYDVVCKHKMCDVYAASCRHLRCKKPSCKHRFCRECIDGWKTAQNANTNTFTCPVCRAKPRICHVEKLRGWAVANNWLSLETKEQVLIGTWIIVILSTILGEPSIANLVAAIGVGLVVFF